MCCMCYMCYDHGMDTTIRNLDARLYRKLRVRAAAEGKTIGAVVNAALGAYFAGKLAGPKATSFFDLPAWDFGPGNERLSEEIDQVLYGERS